jgi:hypothetical protein
VTLPRLRTMGKVEGGKAEVSEEEDVLRRRSSATKMERRPTCRRKLADDGAKEEAGSCVLTGFLNITQKQI